MAKNVFSILRKKFPASEYALLSEVSNAPGFHRSRSADYIVMSLWPSRGLALHGFELKSNRGDWLRELKNPQKAESYFQYCDYFWLLTEDDTVAKLEEIPDTWGWYCIKGERIHTMKEAPKLTPKDIPRSFVACLLKRACDRDEYVHISTIEERIEQAKQAGKDERRYENDSLTKENKELNNILEEFRKESGGIDLNRAWGSEIKDIGGAVKIIQNGGADAIQKQLLGLERTARQIHEQIKNNLSVLAALPKKEEET